jgi:5-methylcytosine-specific restriction endonuclease McrA
MKRQKKVLTYEQQLFRFLIPILRRRSLFWWARNECKRQARRDRGFYECNYCHKLFGGKQVQIDHKIPVINLKTSFTTWDDYIKSLYCDVSNLQCLGVNCHSSKSAVENSLRMINKKRTKSKKKLT